MEEDVSGREDLVLADSVYSVRGNGNDDHAAYSMFGSNYMKNTAKFIGDIMMPGVQVHVLCSALPFALLCRGLALEKKEVQASTRANSG